MHAVQAAVLHPWQANGTNDSGTWPALSVEAVMARYAMPRIDLLKMDIEGSEKEVFTAATIDRWLPRVQVLAAEVHPDMRAGALTAVEAALERYGPWVRTRVGEYMLAARPTQRLRSKGTRTGAKDTWFWRLFG